MKIKYFSDTDTALLEFTNNIVLETREISDNIFIDFDSNGNVVNMTIEHAKISAHLPDLSYQQIEKSVG
jgi:uncharacterized protein YuzE